MVSRAEARAAIANAARPGVLGKLCLRRLPAGPPAAVRRAYGPGQTAAPLRHGRRRVPTASPPQPRELQVTSEVSARSPLALPVSTRRTPRRRRRRATAAARRRVRERRGPAPVRRSMQRGRPAERLKGVRVVAAVRRDREHCFRVDRHPWLNARAPVRGEELVIVDDRSVVDADNRPVPNRMVVRRDRRMPLGVVPHVDEQLRCMIGHRDPIEQHSRRRLLLHDGCTRFLRRAVQVADGVRAALCDPCQERLRRERPRYTATRAKAISGDAAHSGRQRPVHRERTTPGSRASRAGRTDGVKASIADRRKRSLAHRPLPILSPRES